MKDEELVAVITTNRDAIGGDIPTFYAENDEAMEIMANTLSRVMRAMVHDMGNGIYILVKH